MAAWADFKDRWQPSFRPVLSCLAVSSLLLALLGLFWYSVGDPTLRIKHAKTGEVCGERIGLLYLYSFHTGMYMCTCAFTNMHIKGKR